MATLVDRVTLGARDADFLALARRTGRLALAALAGLLYAVGWVVARDLRGLVPVLRVAWFGTAWVGTAVRLGWQEGWHATSEGG